MKLASKFSPFVLFVLLAGPLAANTLLTNGVPVQVVLPDVPTPTVLSGPFGFAIYAPPGATRLTVLFEPSNSGYVADLLVKLNADVGLTGSGAVSADFVGTSLGQGVKEVVVTPQTVPNLQEGTYYIGFNVITLNQTMGITVTATVEGGSIPPVRTVAVSTFDSDLDGWTRNSAASGLPGSSQGEPRATIEWRSSGGKPGGYVLLSEAGGPGLDALVAPAKFLGNLSELVEPRFEFDLKPVSGPGPEFLVEIRIFGAGSAYNWVSSAPPPPPDDPACYPSPLGLPPEFCRWRHYTALLEQSQWGRLTGEKSLRHVLANVQRIEVIADLSLSVETTGLDNFVLYSRGIGPPAIVLPGNTSFASGADRWTRNFPATDIPGATLGDENSTFRWVPVEGNPAGYIRITDAGGPNRDAAVVPSRFLGNFGGIVNPQIEFDYLHSSFGGATEPVEVRLIGAGSVFVWTGAVPGRTWTRHVAPLDEASWRRVSGSATLAQALANVLRIEISADQAEGGESNSVDNFWVLPASAAPAPPVITSNPPVLAFAALARSANPAAQSLAVTSMAGGSPLSFNASATSDRNWLRISAERGTTPLVLNASADVSGLAEGTYTGRIRVVPVNPAADPQTVTVTLTVAARPGPTPRLNTGGAVNAASSRAQLAPGGLGTLYGLGLGPTPGVTAAFLPGTSTLPTKLAGVRLLINETYGALISEAPLLYVSDTQVNFQLPFETFGRAEVQLVVDNNGNLGAPHSLQVVASSPGIFTYGANRAVAVNEDGAVNSSEVAASRGSLLTIYMTGQGLVTPLVATGSAAPARPLARAPFATRAWVGGVPAEVLFIGLTPGLVGVLQVNLVVPFGAPAGDTPVVVDIGGWASNTPLVSVR